jgi:hypothetical protein
MAETFASGFAQAFIRARERTEDKQREKEREDKALALQEKNYLRSRADQLTDEKRQNDYAAGIRLDENVRQDKLTKENHDWQEKQTAFAVANQRQESDFQVRTKLLFDRVDERKAASKKEQDYVNTANTLAGGDSALGGTYLSLLRTNQFTGPQLLAMHANGELVKRKDYVPPTQTLQTTYQPTMALPAGVAGPPTPIKTGAEGLGMSKEEVARINSLSPELLGEGPRPDYGNIDTTGLAYEIKPKDEFKVLPMAEAINKYEVSKANKDPVGMAEAQRHIDINKRVKTYETVEAARAQGKNVNTYISIGEDGAIADRFPGEFAEDQKVYNVGDPQHRQQVTGHVMRLDDKDVERLDKLHDEFGKQSKDVDTASTAYVTALKSTQGMYQLLSEDKEAATMSSNMLGTLSALGVEAKAAYKSMLDLEQTIQSKAESGNENSGIESDIAKYNDLAEKFATSDHGVLSDANMAKAVNAAKYRSLQMQTAYGIAQATSTDGKVSNQDLKNALDIIGKNSDREQILPALQGQMQNAFLKLASMQDNVDNNPSVKLWESEHKNPATGKPILTGLKSRRIGDKILALPIPTEQKQLLMSYQRDIFTNKEMGVAQANQSAKIQQIQQGQGQPQPQPQMKKVDLNALPPEKREGAINLLRKNPTPEIKAIFKAKYDVDPEDYLKKGI